MAVCTEHSRYMLVLGVGHISNLETTPHMDYSWHHKANKAKATHNTAEGGMEAAQIHVVVKAP